MHSDRIKTIITKRIDTPKKYVLYWMQQSQRASFNHALEQSICIANRANLPLIVFFGIAPSFPGANLRHYRFMIEGIVETKEQLNAMGIQMIIKIVSPEQGVLDLIADAHSLVMDMGYTKIQRKWRNDVYVAISRSCEDLDLIVVESDLIVPIAQASDKMEYGAYTLRPKIHKLFNKYQDVPLYEPMKIKKNHIFAGEADLSNLDRLLEKIDLNKEVPPSPIYKGGFKAANRRLQAFIDGKLGHYLESNDPSTDFTSKLSMYLHFGQISALEIYTRVKEAMDRNLDLREAGDAFLEQLIVRRELAFNFVHYNPRYDEFEHMTEPWAYKTMSEHRFDFREHLYSLNEIEKGWTHDPYFNAAMNEMRITGYMHSYMRMYWAKKIIEWSKTHEEAYETIKHLNDKWFIDGRDPNSYASIAWCFGKHDRPWMERPIFGKLRFMNDSGLKRKFNIEAYIQNVEDIVQKYS